MARDMAWISTWGRPVKGREKQSLEVFLEFQQWWAQQAEAGKVQPMQIFQSLDGSDALAIVRGKSDALIALAESDELQTLTEKGHMIVEDLKVHWYWDGTDEEIQRNIQAYADAGSQLGFM